MFFLTFSRIFHLFFQFFFTGHRLSIRLNSFRLILKISTWYSFSLFKSFLSRSLPPFLLSQYYDLSIAGLARLRHTYKLRINTHWIARIDIQNYTIIIATTFRSKVTFSEARQNTNWTIKILHKKFSIFTNIVNSEKKRKKNNWKFVSRTRYTPENCAGFFRNFSSAGFRLKKKIMF